jgi:hypothetical protein
MFTPTKLTEMFNSGERGAEWAHQCSDAIIEKCNVGAYERGRDQLCYDLFNGDTNTNTFDYLTGEGEMKYPAQVRFIPIIRPLFEVLRSTEATRPFEPQVYTIDPISTEEKQDKMYRQVIDKVISRISTQTQQLDLLKLQIDYNRQQLQAAQQPQEGQQPGQMQNPSQMINLQRMEMQLRQVEDIAERSRQVFTEEMAKAQKHYKYNYRTALEIAVSVGLRWWIARYSMDELFLDGFNDLFITDNEIYHIHDATSGTDPRVSRCSPLNIFYPAQENVRYIDESDWAMHVQWMSPSQILQNFPSISSEKVKQLKDGAIDIYASSMWSRQSIDARRSTSQGTTNFADGGNSMAPYTGSSLISDSIPVYHTVWRVWEKVDEDELIKAGVSGDLICDDEYEEKDKIKTYRYISYVWECTRIGNDTYLEARQCPFQFRDQETVGYSYLPYCGYAYNGADKKPYSLVWAVRDIQELYNLVHYQLELMIAMSGVKGFIMDESQMPAGMKKEEWLYYLKQGVGFIESMKKGARPALFNQFSTFDMTIGPGVQLLTGVLERLEYLAGRLIGVPPQRLGEITTGDQVGTHRSAIAQSTLTTEMLFHKHRKLLNRVMNRVILVAREAWREGKRGQFVAGDLGQEIFSLDPGAMDSASMTVFFADVSKETKIMESLMQMAGAQYNAGNIRLGQMTQLFKANTLKEMEATLTEFEEIAMRQAQAVEGQKAASEQEKLRIQEEYAAREKQVIGAAEMIQQKIAEMDAQVTLQQEQMRNNALIKAKEMDASQKSNEAGLKASVDMANLNEEIRHNQVEERISQLELALSRSGSGSSSSGSGS